MTHVNLDAVDESVRRFVLLLPATRPGRPSSRNGRPVAWIVPASPSAANGDQPWTEAKNHAPLRSH